LAHFLAKPLDLSLELGRRSLGLLTRQVLLDRLVEHRPERAVPAEQDGHLVLRQRQRGLLARDQELVAELLPRLLDPLDASLPPPSPVLALDDEVAEGGDDRVRGRVRQLVRSVLAVRSPGADERKVVRLLLRLTVLARLGVDDPEPAAPTARVRLVVDVAGVGPDRVLHVGHVHQQGCTGVLSLLLLYEAPRHAGMTDLA